jgi:hypothetical protein
MMLVIPQAILGINTQAWFGSLDTRGASISLDSTQSSRLPVVLILLANRQLTHVGDWRLFHKLPFYIISKNLDGEKLDH